jgi:2-dehydropantoate 2-reductase
MRKLERICVVGAGTIGSLFAGHLGTVVEVTILTRREEQAEDLNKNGLTISGKSTLHTDVLASTDPTELGDIDLIILATKTPAVEASAKHLQGHFPDATVITVQNGLGCEEIVHRYGDWSIVSSVTFMSGVRHSDTHVEYELDTATWMGPWAGTDATYEDVKQLAALINKSGLIAEGYVDPLPHQWSKLIFNSTLNSIAAITNLPHVKAFAKRDNIEDLGHLVYQMIAEGKRIANARGVVLAGDPWEMNVKAVKQGSSSDGEYAHIASMLDDTRNKRLTEVDWITGALVREARKANIPAPYHETLYRLIKAREASWSQCNDKGQTKTVK